MVSLHELLLSEGFEVDNIIPTDKSERESLSSDYFRKVLVYLLPLRA